MDPRVVPEVFCQFNPGQFGVIRNGGGRAVNAEHDIAFLTNMLEFDDIVVIHHESEPSSL